MTVLARTSSNLRDPCHVIVCPSVIVPISVRSVSHEREVGHFFPP
jgi:hypothetical protein